MEPQLTRTIAYLRVSTDKQADHGISLDAQRAKVEAYASLYDLHVVDVVIDAGQSGKTLSRPGLQRALRALRSGEADALLVAKLDRLTRSVRDLGVLLDHHLGDNGAALLSVSEAIDTRSAAGRLLLNVLTSVAQWERETIGERTKTALAHKKARGEYTGGLVPYGWLLRADGTTLDPNPPEQAVIAEAVTLRAKGLSLRQVALDLDRRGMTSRRGTPFSPSVIAKMCDGLAA